MALAMARGNTALSATLTLLAVWLASGCASIQVNHDYDPEADFAGLQTWSWSSKPRIPTGDVRVDDNTLLDARIRKAIVAELMAKGYRQLDSGKPDFHVAYHVSISEKLSLSTLNNSYGYHPRWGPTGGGYASTYVSQYDEGSLILDVLLPTSNQLIWRGSAATEIDEEASPSERDASVRKAVAMLLALFPPPPE